MPSMSTIDNTSHLASTFLFDILSIERVILSEAVAYIRFRLPNK